MGPLWLPGGEDSAITHLRATNVQLNAPPARRASAAPASDVEQPNRSTDTPEETADIASSGLRPRPASETRPQSIDVANWARDQHAASAPVVQPTARSDGGGGGIWPASPPLPPSPLSIERTRKTARA